MPGFPAPFITFREDDRNGLPLAGGKLWSYKAGTSTPYPTFTTQALTIPNQNPTILDASGRASIFVEDGVGYDFVLNDALDNLVWSQENVQVPKIATPPPPAATPPGGIIAFGGSTIPAGWLLCDGRPVSTTTYQDLFAVILYTFGGAGSSFNLPDLRQRFPLGKAATGTGAALGRTGGAIDHTHSVPRAGWVPRSVAPATAVGYLLTTTGAGTGTVDVPTGDSTSGTANPAYIALHFIIKT